MNKGKKDTDTNKIEFPGGHHPEARIADEDRRDRDRMGGEGPMPHVRAPDPKSANAKTGGSKRKK